MTYTKGPTSIVETSPNTVLPFWSIGHFGARGEFGFVYHSPSPKAFIPEYFGQDVKTPVHVIVDDGASFRDVTAAAFNGAPFRVTLSPELLAADFNGDGRTDVFVAGSGHDSYGPDGLPIPGGSPGELAYIATTNPEGLLTDRSSTLAGAAPSFAHSTDAADIDGDGDLDIYVSSISVGEGRTAYFLINDGHGNFTRTDRILPDELIGYPSGPVTRLPDGSEKFSALRYTGSKFADVNGDGHVDLVLMALAGTATSRVLLNDGKGTFKQSVNLPPSIFGEGYTLREKDGVYKVYGAVNHKPLLIDIDNDGDLDIISTQTLNYEAKNLFYSGESLQILRNEKGSYFDDTQNSIINKPDFTANHNYWYKILSVDFNGDDYRDIIAIGNDFRQKESSGFHTNLFVNDGNGKFLETTIPDVPYLGIVIPLDYNLNSFAHMNFNIIGNDGRLGIFETQLTKYSRPETFNTSPSFAKVISDFRSIVRIDDDVTARGYAAEIDLGDSAARGYLPAFMDLARDSSLPGLIAYQEIMGRTPTSSHLDALSVFVKGQINSPGYQSTANPRLGGYEAMGLGLSETAEFKAKFGDGTDASMISTEYQHLFGRAASSAQIEHFVRQIDYFEGLYIGVGISETDAAVKARGAVVGQMLGYAAEEKADIYDAAVAFLMKAADGTAVYGSPLEMI